MARRPSQADFDRVAELGRRAIQEATDQLASGEIDADRWGEKVHSILANRHAQARTLGRKRGGDLAMFDEGDREYGRLMADRDRPYLDGYVQAIKDGKYTAEDGAVRSNAMASRNEKYVRKLRGTANRAIPKASAAGATFIWKLGEADHCPDCVRWSEGGPYLADRLPAYPGDGTSECRTNCQCELVRDDGVREFEVAPDDTASPVDDDTASPVDDDTASPVDADVEAEAVAA